ncbi:MAG TPA: glucosyl-3-phosphoglycerate synthase [Thermoleophilaceae bacterium]|nr:glucosyl-3-phosphoglycerate synthase [Thermoleophilaceae bacterium]
MGRELDLERARRWHESRTLHHSDFPPERLSAERTASVSVCVPARNEAGTVGAIVADLVSLREAGVVDQVAVIDAGSTDGTAEVASSAGAQVFQESSLMPEVGAPLGKGDAMWRSLSVLEGDVLCWVDADSGGFGPHFVCGLIGPLLCGDPEIQFVKAFYRRPFKVGEVALPEGGGRVTELTARPLLNLFYPQLAGIRQPLAGEVAGRRELMRRIPFGTGYSVEIAMLIDVWSEVGLDGLAQVDIEMRQNRHQALGDLTPMAFAVLRAVAARLAREGRIGELEDGSDLLVPVGSSLEERHLEQLERPPLASLVPPKRAG